ncbi:Cof-type HAD-IIB family hydrolase [Lachnospiraceae bacterium 62-35]
MKDIRLLALDLDGTLTNSQKHVSDKNKVFIQRAQKKGIQVILASGRPVIGMIGIAEELSLWNMGGYILAYNGGHIIDCKTGKDLVKHTVPMQYVHDICEVVRKFNVYPLTYNDIGVICENEADRYVHLEGYNNSIPIIKVKRLETEITTPAVKFMVVGDPDELQKAYRYLKRLFKGNLNVFFSEPYFMEITPLGIQKASALAQLSEILGIKRDQIMACGDGLNDIPMLEYAGLAVAMDNAYPETKKAADYIVASNEEDGVAEAIERFILEG